MVNIMMTRFTDQILFIKPHLFRNITQRAHTIPIQLNRTLYPVLVNAQTNDYLFES